MHVIEVPKSLTLKASIGFVNELASIPEAAHYLFDFSNLMWVEPFGLLYVSQALCNLKHKHPASEFEAKINRSNSTFYASWMGFFKACEFDYGNDPGQAPGSNTYIPVTFTSIAELLEDAWHPQEHIERLSKQLAAQLLQQNAGALYLNVAYSFREIIRNVTEHSQSESLGYCAQYWPSKGSVEIAIIDTGVGLRTTLQENPHLHTAFQETSTTQEADRTAIKLALLPGVSGKAYEGAVVDHDDEWKNSGYGLWMTYRLCNEGGNFFIASGSQGLYRRKDEDNGYCDTNFSGTVLRLRLKVSQLDAYQALLNKFRKEGEAIAADFEGAVPTASKMSSYIRG